MKKAILIAAKLLIVGLVTWFVWGTLEKAWLQIGQHPLEIHPAWLVLSGVIYLIALLPAGWYWRHVLLALGQEARLGETLQAYYLGHLGKYVPGKAMVIVLRTGLIRSHRIDTTLAVVSVFYETLTMMAVGSFLAVGILAFRLHEDRSMLWASLAFMLLAGLPTLPPVFRLILQGMQIAKRKTSSLSSEEGTETRAASHDTSPHLPATAASRNLLTSAQRLGYGTVFIGWLAMLLVWCGMAASLWAVFQACGLQKDLFRYFPEFTAAVCLSVVAGFLALIPGGLGVRDLILTALLVGMFHIGEAPAAVAAGLLRLTWLVAEILTFAVLYPLRIKHRRNP